MRLNDAILGIVFALVGAAVVYESQSFPPVPGHAYGSAFFPMLIGFGFGIVGVGLVVQGVRDRPVAPWMTLPDWARNRLALVRLTGVLGALIAYILLADLLGFIVTATILLVFLQLLLGVRPATALACAVAVTGLIELVFGFILRVPLPRGVLESLIL